MHSYYRIYQFRPDVQPRDLDTLLASRIWSASIESLNDPFEFHSLKAIEPKEAMREQFVRAGVACFCRAVTNPLLWAHYANGHAGFAVGYDPAHPFFGGDKGLSMRILHDVRYEDIPPSADFLRGDELAMAAVLTKPTCWAYEQEVRLITRECNQLVDVPKGAIRELILGARMPHGRATEIIKKVRSGVLDLNIAKMNFSIDSYGVKPQWIAD